MCLTTNQADTKSNPATNRNPKLKMKQLTIKYVFRIQTNS